MTLPGNPLRIAFISGPADTNKIFSEWSQERQEQYFGTDYMKQFLQLASDLGAVSHVVTWQGDARHLTRQGSFIFDNRPITRASGPRYILEHIWWNLKLLPVLLRFRPDILLLTGNQQFWWTLAPVRWSGTKVVISYHAVLWPQFGKVSRSWRALLRLNERLILRHASVILATSHAIRRQVEQLLDLRRSEVPVLTHLPTFSPVQFAAIRAPDATARPFRVAFFGRMVANKGVFTLLDIAARLQKERPGGFVLDLCGDGAALEALRARVKAEALGDVVAVHGYCRVAEAQARLSEAHACIVPTRSDFEAGFEMTCAESILAGRPLVTSRVCPAIEYMREATIEVEPDDVDGYHDAIVRLADDPDLYARLRAACGPLQAQFYDPANSWLSVMRGAIDRHVVGRAAP